MLIQTFSPKQMEVMAFALDDRPILIADGAVRSGKTVAVSISYVAWAMEAFDKATFIIAGKTVSSTERNVIMPLMTIENLPYDMHYRRSDRQLVIRGNGGRENYFYVFGGKDESSYGLVQGLTASGAMFDEVALQPQSFVDQAIARTLASDNAKIFFNCNPENPEHYIYQTYIAVDRPDVKHLHFMMKDNPIMTSAMIARAERLYSGIFYRRYILGQWVRAEGIIFGQFANNTQNWIIDELTEEEKNALKFITFGVDYGENTSHTVFIATGLTRSAGQVYALAERKLDSKGVDPAAIEDAFVDFVRDVMRLYPGVRLTYAFCDHPETITNGINKRIRKEKLPVVAVTAIKEEINTRIYAQEKMLNLGIIKIHRRCSMLIHSLSNQVWDEKKQTDTRLDVNPDVADIADAWEYSWMNFIDEIGVR